MSNKRRKNKMNIILTIILTAILLLFAAEFIIYILLKADAVKYKTADVSIKNADRLDVVGMLDSYGVPFSPDVKYSFLDIYTDKLNDAGKLNSKLDMFGLFLNKTWHLDGIFRNGVTVEEMAKMQDFSVEFVRHKYGDRIRTDLKYAGSEKAEDKTVFDYLAGLDNPVICYSCSANDLFYYYGFSLEGLNAEKCIELVNGFNDARNLLSVGVKGNIDTLLECNPDSQIYVFGLYVPSDNFFIQRLGSIVTDTINRDLRSICNQYDSVHFVDVSCVSFEVLEGDFHPNQTGQKIIASKLAEAINDTYFPVNSIRTPGLYKNTTPLKTESTYKSCVNEIIAGINTTSLPINDYVEAAVAVEQILRDLEIENMDYQDLSLIKSEIVSGVKPEIRINISIGINICVIERKTLYGVVESEYSSHPETVLNDKLSLIAYY